MKRPPVSFSAPSETEVSETKYSETDSLFTEDEEDRNSQPILRRKSRKRSQNMIETIFGDWYKINLDERVFLKQPVI